jgi:preprotein translocase subunit SecD
MKSMSLLLLAVLFPTSDLAAEGATDACAAFCIRLTSYEQRPGFTIEKVHGGIETVWVSRHVEMGVEIVERAEYVHDPFGEPAVLLSFTESGERSFREFSASNIEARIAIFVGGELLMAPVITAPVEDEKVMISGLFGEQEAKDFVRKLNENVE